MTSGGAPDSASDRLYDLGFFTVEAFAALEVTAVIVANARITAGLGLPERLSSLVLNSYLVPLFSVMLLVLALSGWIRRTFAPTPFFLAGLALFSAGNVACFLSHSPTAFFTGRAVMGVGGALAFAGQLWTLSDLHRARITRPLVWGEVGAALGVVAGPMVGAFFAQVSPEGWRSFFLLNAGLAAATIVLAGLGLRHRTSAAVGAAAEAEPREGRRTAAAMTAWQVVVSILVVGAEYLFSDWAQAKAGKSPAFVGTLTALASAGAILGSLWAVRLGSRLARVPPWTAAGLFASLLGLAASLSAGAFAWASVPIFASGVCMGLASVSIYASIVESSAPRRFLPRSMVYLIGMQAGNALGIGAVGLAENLDATVFGTAALLAVVPALVSAGILSTRPRPA
ncbi:MAG: MFS transporter [Holophagales bacterium]|nr:MFS transporter [Holophagales bacterium]MBK9965019.1 MFS transporter [Holophagales bacterium]